jgi:integrase
MELKPRDGKWHASGYYWDARTQRRKRWRRSTGVPVDGRARTKRLAEQTGHQIASSYTSGAVRRARALTLEDAIKIHVIARERAGRKPATLAIVAEKSVWLFEHFGADFDCSTVTDAHLEQYADWRRAQPGKRKGSTVAPLTVHRELLTLVGSLKDSKRAGKYDGAIPMLPDLGTLYVPRERWLTAAETKALLLAIPTQWRDHVVMYRQLGLDECELYALERSDIDWKARELRIRGTKNAARVRVLPISDEIYEILERRAGRDRVLFERWTGNNCALRRACSKAGIERCCLKDLRRSFATELAIAGVPALHLQKLMGHASGKMLERVYARVERGEHMHDAIRLLAELRPPAAVQRRSGGEDP